MTEPCGGIPEVGPDVLSPADALALATVIRANILCGRGVHSAMIEALCCHVIRSNRPGWLRRWWSQSIAGELWRDMTPFGRIVWLPLVIVYHIVAWVSKRKAFFA